MITRFICLPRIDSSSALKASPNPREPSGKMERSFRSREKNTETLSCESLRARELLEGFIGEASSLKQPTVVTPFFLCDTRNPA